MGDETRKDKPESCGECGASLLADGSCIRCAPPVMFRPDWLEPDGGRDIVELQPHEKVNR